MSRPVVVVANRNALHLRAPGPMLEALRGARSEGAILRETWSLDALAEVADFAADRDARTVVLAGGDGTLMAGLTELRRAFTGRPMPGLAIVPGGTVCTVGRNFGVSGRLPYTKRVLSAVTRGTSRRSVVRPLVVRDDQGRARSGFIFGLGLVSSFFDAYYDGRPGEALGLGHAARIVSRVFAGSFVGGALARRVLTPQPARIAVDGAEASHEGYSLFVASVVRDLGLHMHLTYRAGERLDRFHAVGSALGPSALGPQMPRVLAGRGLRGPGIDTLASSVSVGFTGERRGYVLDGELFEASRVDVSLGDEVAIVTP